MRSRRPYKRTLTLDKENKKFLGVCAGVARYLEVEIWTVRMVFVVSIFFGGWFLIPLYFIAWFCLDDKPGEGLSNLADSQPLKHFRTVDYKKQLYRNTEDGKFLGVCAGVADYLEVNVFAVRLAFLILVFFTAALPLALYFAAYFILEEKPYTRPYANARRRRREERQRKRRRDVESAVEAGVAAGMEAGMAAARSMKGKSGDREDTAEYEDAEEAGHEEYGPAGKTEFHSKRREFKYCARKFATLQDRLAKMEAYVTSNQFRLHREFKNI